MENLAQRIRAARQEAGWTQQKLANEMGVSGTAIYEWERGKFNPRYEHLVRLSKLLGIPLAYLTDTLPGAPDSPQDARSPGEGARMDPRGKGDTWPDLADLGILVETLTLTQRKIVEAIESLETRIARLNTTIQRFGLPAHKYRDTAFGPDNE